MDENEEFQFRARAEAEAAANKQSAAPTPADTFDAGTMSQADTQKYLQDQYSKGHTNIRNALTAVPQAVGSMAVNSLAPVGAGAESLLTGKPYSETAANWRYSPDNPDAQALLQGAGSIPGLKQVGQGIGALGSGLSSVTGGYISPEAATDAISTALMFGPGLAVRGAKAYAASKLKDAMNAAPARASTQLAQAEKYPVNLTVAQTVGPGKLRDVATQVQGPLSAEAGQAQADAHALLLLQKARRLAPLPITSPGAAESTVNGVSKAIEKYETDLKSRASRGYERGAAQVAALSNIKPQPIQFPALTAAMRSIQDQTPNLWNTAPDVVQPRVQALLDARGGKGTYATRGQTGGGISTQSAFDALQLGKSLNQQFDTAEMQAITPAMKSTFAQLKSAYKTDLENAPASPAIDRLRSVNSEYVNGQARIQKLQDSVVAGVVRRLGNDPDKAMRDFSTMNPSVQRYTRGVLSRYSPDTLHALQGHYIDMHLNDAAPIGRDVFSSRTDIHALNPESLAKTGIFDSKTAQELNNAQASINTIRGFFPEPVGSKYGANLQEASRLTGGIVGKVASPVFGYGMALRILSGGKLEKLLLTPEGRTALLNGATDPQAATKLIRNVALYNNYLTTPQPAQQ
jgi:hypothetical protein